MKIGPGVSELWGGGRKSPSPIDLAHGFYTTAVQAVMSVVHRFNKAGARCSTNLAPLKCWGVEIVDFDLILWLDLQHGELNC